VTEGDDSTAKEIAREAARVLPLVGCPRWALWLGTLLAVVLYVAGKRLIPSVGHAIVEALKNAKVEPGTVADEGGVIVDRGAKEGGGPAGGENGSNG
jgi:hypothetical protein